MNSLVFTRSVPPTIEEVIVYFNANGATAQEAETFFLLYEGRKWRSRNLQFLKNWKTPAFHWISSVIRHQPISARSASN
jgi:hypothetical protein